MTRRSSERAAWVSVAAAVAAAAAVLGAAGCVEGTPFEPEMCELRPEGLTAQVPEAMLRVCALPQIATEVRP